MIRSHFDLTGLDLITEKLSRAERIKKVVKNFGVELEVAHRSGDTDEAADQLNDAFRGETWARGDIEFSSRADLSKGSETQWLVENDGSANLDEKDGGISEEVSNDIIKMWRNWTEDAKQSYIESKAEDLQNEYDDEHRNAIGSLESILEDIVREEDDPDTEAVEKMLKDFGIENAWDDGEDEEEEVKLTSKAIQKIIKTLSETDPDRMEEYLDGLMPEDEYKYIPKEELQDFDRMAEDDGYDNDWNDELVNFITYHLNAGRNNSYIYDFVKRSFPDEDDPDVNSWIHNLDPEQIGELIGNSDYSESSGYSSDLEIVSPRFASTDENLKGCAEILHRIPDIVDGVTHAGAGLHVHVGIVQGMTPMDLLKIIYQFAVNEEKFIALSRRDTNHYTRSVSYAKALINDGAMESYRSRDMDHLKDSIKKLSSEAKSNRYHVLNLASASKHGTAEIRIGSSEIVDNENATYQWLKIIRDSFNEALGGDWLELDLNEEGKHFDEGFGLRINSDNGRLTLQYKDKNTGWKTVVQDSGTSTVNAVPYDDFENIQSELANAIKQAGYALNKEKVSQGQPINIRDPNNLLRILGEKLGWEDENYSQVSSHLDDTLHYFRTGEMIEHLRGDIAKTMDILLANGYVPTWEKVRNNFGLKALDRQGERSQFGNFFGQKRYDQPGQKIDPEVQSRMNRDIGITSKQRREMRQQRRQELDSSSQAERVKNTRLGKQQQRQEGVKKNYELNLPAINKAMKAVRGVQRKSQLKSAHDQFMNYLNTTPSKRVSSRHEERGVSGVNDPRPFIRWVNSTLGRRIFEDYLELLTQSIVTERSMIARGLLTD